MPLDRLCLSDRDLYERLDNADARREFARRTLNLLRRRLSNPSGTCGHGRRVYGDWRGVIIHARRLG